MSEWPKWIPIPPPWFDEAEYLEANKGVASSPFFKSRPFEHFISSGYPQKFTWKSDPRPPVFRQSSPPPDDGTGSLQVGDRHKVWVTKFSGKEDHTTPTEENPEFIRHNIKRAYHSKFSYWYSSRRHGKGYVDYKPDFGKLGVGKYRIETPVRMTRNRAKYDAIYTIFDGRGNVIHKQSFNQRADPTRYADVELGTHHMDAGSFVRISDTRGSSSIAMAHMYFLRVS